MSKHLLPTRLWKYIKKLGPDQCWEWQRGTNPLGYGWTSYDGTTNLVHRQIWKMVKGPIPNGLCVLHRCDNPPCCNPKHLWLGTRTDNNTDKALKGRVVAHKGEKHARSRYTEKQVREMRKLYASGLYTYENLADKFGGYHGNIAGIVRRTSWKHVV